MRLDLMEKKASIINHSLVHVPISVVVNIFPSREVHLLYSINRSVPDLELSMVMSRVFPLA